MLALTLLLACAPPEGPADPSLDPSALGVDRLNGVLTSGTSLCQYERTAPDYPPPDNSGNWLADWEMSAYLDCSDGSIHADWVRYEDDRGVEYDFSVNVQFFEVTTPYSGWVAGEVLDPLEGIDDCEVIRLDQTGTITGFRGEVDYLKSPYVELGAGRWSSELVDYNGSPSNRVSTYSLWTTQDDGPAPGATLSLTVDAGDTAPELDLEDVLTLPDPIELTAPRLSWEATLPRRDTSFQWNAGDPADTVELSLFMRSEFNGQQYPMYEVTCEVSDDGEFTVPDSILGLADEGWSARVEARRRHMEWVGTIQGRSYRTIGQSRHTGANLLLGP